MVKRVFGRVDGIEVVLQYINGGRWSVPVPLDQDGEYVVEVIAEDEAGNWSYMARMLFCVDASKLCAHIMPIPYFAEMVAREYEAKLIRSQYYAELIESQCEWRGAG